MVLSRVGGGGVSKGAWLLVFLLHLLVKLVGLPSFPLPGVALFFLGVFKGNGNLFSSFNCCLLGHAVFIFWYSVSDKLGMVVDRELSVGRAGAWERGCAVGSLSLRCCAVQSRCS